MKYAKGLPTPINYSDLDAFTLAETIHDRLE
jgi:hypothetical protein